jgi:PAS domain S-box-containing protein
LEDRIVVCGVIRDISKRKQAEKALRESEENFRALAENANDGILIAVGEGEHAYANKHAAEITGYSVSELLKTTIKDLAHPDELKKIKERFRTILAGKPFQKHYETKIIRKDGKEVSIEVASATSIWQGQPADIVIIRDISQRNRD